MKTQQSVAETIMQILAANLQLDMPHPVAARKKVTKEIIELFDQQTVNLKLINGKQAELIVYLKQELNIYVYEGYTDIDGKIKQFESELASLQEGKEKEEPKLEPLKHSIFRLKSDAIRRQIGYNFPNEIYIECTGIIMACDQILEWMKEEPTAMEMIKEVFEPIQLPENEVVNQALALASKKAGKVENRYNVSRYFDDVFEVIMVDNLTKDEAKKKATELNNMKPRAYVEYLVRES